jgi:hypothetical protein
VSDTYTSSRNGVRTRTPPQRSATVSARIAARFKDIQRKTLAAATAPRETSQVIFSASDRKQDEDDGSDGSETERESPPPRKLDKGKGKAVNGGGATSPPPSAGSHVSASPPSMSPMLSPDPRRIAIDIVPPSPLPAPAPPPMVIAGLTLPVAAVSALLKRAAAELPLRPMRIPLLGEYPDCFTGSEFVIWLTENVKGLSGSLDLAEDAAKDLTEREGLLRRIGELGNSFEGSDDAFYQFRPKVRFLYHADFGSIC